MVFWMSEYDRIRLIFLSQSGHIDGQLHETRAHAAWNQLVTILRQPQVNETEFVNSLSGIADVLTSAAQGQEQSVLLKAFTSDLTEFSKLVRKNSIAAEQRNMLLRSLTEQEQHEHDLRLFQGEGMWYSLEYYLKFYRHLTTATTDEEKRALIEQKEIPMEYGNLPGLWYDFFVYEEL